jgi:hypothetical protein
LLFSGDYLPQAVSQMSQYGSAYFPGFPQINHHHREDLKAGLGRPQDALDPEVG